MPHDDWTLTLPPARELGLARAHLSLGVAALIGSGLLAVVLVLSRTPGLSTLLPLREIFRAALVVHVDLSVLIWFMAFASLAWSLITPRRWLAVGWLGWGLAAVGTAGLLVSPFLPGATPLLNNYIPVLEQPFFLGSLTLCGAGFGLTMLRVLVWAWPQAGQPAGERALQLGVRLSAVAGALAWLALAWTHWQLPDGSGVGHFEQLFWGPGHVLQFQHALLAGVAWLWLAWQVGAQPAVGAGTTRACVALAALPLLAVPLLYTFWPVGHPRHMDGFALLMRWGHLLMLPLGLLALRALPGVWRAAAAPARSAFLASLLLFATGGVLALLIRGVNVVIPAHYHGSIVGVTLAFMGLAYALMPALGFRPVTARFARWQPLVYGGGQLMHVLGLAWSGGYGVQRKVAGSDQVLHTVGERVGMGMMGLGGLIAVIGGVMFVVACLQAMWPRPQAQAMSR